MTRPWVLLLRHGMNIVCKVCKVGLPGGRAPGLKAVDIWCCSLWLFAMGKTVWFCQCVCVCECVCLRACVRGRDNMRVWLISLIKCNVLGKYRYGWTTNELSRSIGLIFVRINFRGRLNNSCFLKTNLPRPVITNRHMTGKWEASLHTIKSTRDHLDLQLTKNTHGPSATKNPAVCHLVHSAHTHTHRENTHVQRGDTTALMPGDDTHSGRALTSQTHTHRALLPCDLACAFPD